MQGDGVVVSVISVLLVGEVVQCQVVDSQRVGSRMEEEGFDVKPCSFVPRSQIRLRRLDCLDFYV